MNSKTDVDITKVSLKETYEQMSHTYNKTICDLCTLKSDGVCPPEYKLTCDNSHF